MALTYAFAAVDAITTHPDDLRSAAIAYDEAVRDEADAVYRESAAMDRVRQYRWNGEEIPDWDQSEVERQDLIFCVAAGAAPRRRTRASPVAPHESVRESRSDP